MFVRRQSFLCIALPLSLCISSYSEPIKIPVMTPVYVQIDQRVTSKKKETSEGDIVRAHVWRDVRVNGNTVISAGSPVFCRVSEVQKARVAGREGSLEIRAMSVPGVDGEDIALEGGYDKSGNRRVGAAVATALLLAWPLIFIKGKNAVLEGDTVFDCWVQAGSSVELPSEARPVISLRNTEDLSVVVLYDEIQAEKKMKSLPFKITVCTAAFDAARVVTVNGAEIEALPLEVDKRSIAKADDCFTGKATADFKKLSKHFTKGINRFDVEVNGKRTEVILDLEL